jgi:hypothetical protein
VLQVPVYLYLYYRYTTSCCYKVRKSTCESWDWHL